MLALLIAAAAAPQAEQMIAEARRLTAVATRCAPADTTDITVCGRRAADRFRVPLIERDPTLRRNQGVPAEREELLHRTTPVEDLSPFLVGGGMAGVTVRQGFGDTSPTVRPLAP